MSASSTDLIVRLLRPLFRARGRARWLGWAILGGIVILAWWRLDLLDSATQTGVHGPARSQSATSLSASDPSRPSPNPRPDNDAVAQQTAGRWQDDGRGTLRSPAGLVYTRGSSQGHRIAHIMAHNVDNPDRPGQHGVFTIGTQADVLAAIDAAYRQSQRGDSTQRQVDRQRTVLTIEMKQEIGYIGGRVGNRRGRPTARHLRLVLEGDRVITAYPVIP